MEYNALLAKAITFIEKREQSIDKIKLALQKASPSDLVSTFYYFITWISDHYIENNSINKTEQFRGALQISISIAEKVSPIHFLQNNFDLFSYISKLPPNLQNLFEPVINRFLKFKSYFKPSNLFELKSFVHVEFTTNEINKDHQCLYSSFYPESCQLMRKHIKLLIMNRAPLQEFRIFYHVKDVKTILTSTIIEILEDLSRAKLSHIELIANYSNIFGYIRGFLHSNNFDPYFFNNYLRSQPAFSPFMVYALMKTLIPSTYLYHIIYPADTKSFPTFDIVDTSPKPTMNQLVERIPQLYTNFVNNTPRKKKDDIKNEEMKKGDGLSNHEDFKKDEEVFINLLSSTTPQEKLIQLTNLLQSQPFKTMYIFAIDQLNLQNFSIIFVKVYEQFKQKNVSFDNIRGFTTTLFSVIFPFYFEKWATFFFEKPKPPKMILLILQHIYHFIFHLILKCPTANRITKFLMKQLETHELSSISRLIILKLFLCDNLKISSNSIQLISQSNDALSILLYIHKMTNYTQVKDFIELENVKSSRMKLIEQFNIQLRNDSDFSFSSIRSAPNRSFNELTNNLFGFANPAFSLTEFNSQLVAKVPQNDRLWLYIFGIMSSAIDNTSFVDFVIEEINKHAVNSTEGENQSLDIKPSNQYYLLALFLLEKFVSLSKIDSANRIIVVIEPFLKSDIAALHWIQQFLTKYRPVLSSTIRESLERVVSELPSADHYYNPLKKPLNLIALANLVEKNPAIEKVFATTHIIHTCFYSFNYSIETIHQEYNSLFDISFAFAYCLLTLTTRPKSQKPSRTSSLSDPFYDTSGFLGSSIDFDMIQPFSAQEEAEIDVQRSITNEIVDALICPSIQLSNPWKHRTTSCAICSLFAARMDNEISNSYFDALLGSPKNQFVQTACRVFLLNARIDIYESSVRKLFSKFVVQEIRNPHEFIANMKFFLPIFLSTASRLKGNNPLMDELVAQLKKLPTGRMPKDIQESISDTIEFLQISQAK